MMIYYIPLSVGECRAVAYGLPCVCLGVCMRMHLCVARAVNLVRPAHTTTG